MAAQQSLEQRLVRRVIKRLLQTQNGDDALASLNKQLSQECRLTDRELLRILERYTGTFEISGGPVNHTVKLRPCLILCPAHSRESGSCPPGSCDGLHVCKFFLLSGCCVHGQRCLFGHDLSSWHNKPILNRYMLDHLNITELRIVLTIPENRCQVTKPEICHYYNKKFGCKKKNSCRSLHVCRPYVFSKCKFGKNCRREHDIFNEQIQNVLKLYGVSTARQPRYILDELSQYEEDSNYSSGTEGSYADGSDVDSVEEIDYSYVPNRKRNARLQKCRSTPNLANRQNMALAKEPRPRFPSTSRRSHRKSASQSSDDNISPVMNSEICLYYLQGACTYGQQCYKIHADGNFLWQFMPFGDMDDQEDWQTFDDNSNKTLEKFFSQPDLDECLVEMSGEVMKVNFERMTAKSHDYKYNVRRLSAPSSMSPTLQKRKSRVSSAGVIWLWYYQAKHGHWYKVEENESNAALTSDRLEAYYLESPDSQKVLGMIELNFRRMIMTKTRTGEQYKLRRRPMYLPSSSGQSAGHSLPAGAIGKTVRPVQPHQAWEQGAAPFMQTSLAFQQQSLLMENSINSLQGMHHSQPYDMIQLRHNEDEFQMIEKLFRQKIGRSCIILHIYKIRNEARLKHFLEKRRAMSMMAGGKMIFEKQNLFYGASSIEKLKKRCQKGVKCSPPEGSMVFGNGCHLFDSAAKADKCSGQDGQQRHLLIVDCLVGDFGQGFSGLHSPPCKPDGRWYNSCVDDINNPKIFVIFEKSQVVIQYWITYMFA